MKRKPKYLGAEQGGQRERWLISYTDFVTILLILFVAIAAQGFHSAQTPRPPQPRNPTRAQSRVPTQRITTTAQPPASRPDLESRPYPDSRQALLAADAKLRSRGLDSHIEKRGLVISLPQAILFASGEGRVAPTALPIVSEIAEVLNSVPNKVALVGHADSLPIHNQHFHNNWELSAARSVSLLEILSSRFGVAESRLSVQSFGSNDPKTSNETEAGRAENRRVDILLIDDGLP